MYIDLLYIPVCIMAFTNSVKGRKLENKSPQRTPGQSHMLVSGSVSVNCPRKKHHDKSVDNQARAIFFYCMRVVTGA